MGLKTEIGSIPASKVPNRTTQGFAAYGIRMASTCHQYLQDIQFYEKAIELGKKISSTPVSLIGAVFICATFLIPVLCFIIFALVNSVLGLTGFLMIQVVGLTVAASVLGCTLFFIALSLLFFGSCFLLAVHVMRSVTKILKLS